MPPKPRVERDVTSFLNEGISPVDRESKQQQLRGKDTIEIEEGGVEAEL